MRDARQQIAPSRAGELEPVSWRGLFHAGQKRRGDCSSVMDYASSFSEFFLVSEGQRQLSLSARDGNTGPGVAGDVRGSLPS